jgi:hypothetical protein
MPRVKDGGPAPPLGNIPGHVPAGGPTMLKLLTPPAKLTTSRGFCSSMDHAAAILCTEVLMDVWQPKREREREINNARVPRAH